jgi:hypothetical protein
MMTDLALTTSPSSNRISCVSIRDDRATALQHSLIRTPNLCACNAARAANSSPDNPGGKSHVVLDSRRCTGLATESGVLGQCRGQAFRCAVDRSGETCWATADDDQIAHLGGTAFVWRWHSKAECVE